MVQQRSLILVVDDEPEIRALLRACFERDGFAVAEAGTGAEMRARIDDKDLSLVTLDLTLGGEDGLELAREIRGRRNLPIIMITGKGDTIDRVVGLELGADDYIAKPFQLREVLARVRAVLRRYAGAETGSLPQAAGEAEERYAFEDFVLDVGRRELMQGESVRDLTTAEFNLLHIFVKRPRRVLSRDNIMDLLKGHEWSPLDRSIDALVGRLRKRIEAEPNTPQLVKTVRGVGYVFTADTKRL
ncbi:MAG: response regulator [Hyphomicrobiaceae bacterium]|nr:response regulator [Hyphomicrobiaceae bacterium]